jgi:hypothetical protein
MRLLTLRLLTLRLLARCEFLDDDHSTPVVSQQTEKPRALILDRLPHLADDMGDLIPFRLALGDEAVRLPLTIRAILRSCDRGIVSDGHRSLRTFTAVLRRTDHKRA